MGSAVWKYSEKLLCELIGVDRKVLRQARRRGLVQCGDWAVDDGIVAFSETGFVRALKMLAGMPLIGSKTPRAFFGKPLAAIQACCEVDGPLGDGEGTVRFLEVVKVYKNRRMLEARLNGRTQRVIVNDNANFGAGLWIPCELQQADLWRFTERTPRTYGEARRKYRFAPGGHKKESTDMNEKTEFDKGTRPAEPRDRGNATGPKENLGELTKAELVKRCRAMDLPISGNKTELCERITAALA